MKAILLVAVLVAVAAAQLTCCPTNRNPVHYQYWNTSAACTGTAAEDLMYCSADCYSWHGMGYIDVCDFSGNLYEFEFGTSTTCTLNATNIYYRTVSTCATIETNHSEEWTACVPDPRNMTWWECSDSQCTQDCNSTDTFRTGACHLVGDGSMSGRFFSTCGGDYVVGAVWAANNCPTDTAPMAFDMGPMGTCAPTGTGKYMKFSALPVPTPAPTTTTSTVAPTTTKSAASRLSLF
jgi:hypothetical protein